MFRVDQQFELDDPVSLSMAPESHRYSVVAQTLHTPIWRVKVLPASPKGKNKKDLLWDLYLISKTDVAVQFAVSKIWEKVKIEILVPEYMTKSGKSEIATCLTIWEACSLEDPKHPSWIFETDIGTFADPEYGLEVEEAKKVKLHWKK